jgi:SIT4-associating protein SAP185/190
MFWRFGGYANISTLDTVLDKPDVTVEDLLDESDLIQELKQQNGKLIEFLRDEPVLKKLLNYVVTDLPPDTEEKPESPKAEEKDERPSGISFFGKGKRRSRSKSLPKGEGETEQERKEAQRKKYAYVSCEVLSSEVWSITEAVLDQREALREFWQYMHRPAPLDPLQAGYFTKVNETLLDKKTEEMLAFFKSLDGIVPAMLQHVDCPMVMDLLLKIISLEKHEGGAGIVDWLQAQDLIPLLLAFLSPEHNSATQTSAGDFLKAIITISANATTQDQSVIGPNELTRQLVSERCIQTLINDMLRGGNPLTVGVGIIIEVIRKNNSDYDLDTQEGPKPKTTDPIYLGTLLRKFATHVPDFMNLVRSPSAKKPELKAAFGGKIEPLGFDRFKTCELMAELLHCSNMGLLNERGAEADILKRDAERERLKAEGKLATPKAPTSPSQENSHEEFGSSVDSHGFHHAKRPSDDGMDDDEKPEEIRKLEIQNASDEDGFEKVNAPSTDDFPDEVNFDVDDEKPEDTALSKSQETTNKDPTSPKSPSKTEMPKPLSPLKPSLYFDPPPTRAADSPTTAGVTDKIDKLDVDEDTVMTEFGEEPSDSDDDGPSELEKELAKAHPEDKPAPLFARKEPPAPLKIEQTEEPRDIDASVTTIQGEESVMSNGERAPYETEADGNPVVGDLLKIQFVEHQVVPTILVSTCTSSLSP